MDKIKAFLATAKGKVIAAASAVVIVTAVIVTVVLLNKDVYKSIVVEDSSGTVNVTGIKGLIQAFKGQQLYDGDDIDVTDGSSLTLCMDTDKYVYADANTHFVLKSTGKDGSSNIKLLLDKGSELNVLTQKLGDSDSYEVDTPSSTMSVRGTKFRVTVYVGEDGFVYTLLEVYEGNVVCRLKYTTGEYNGVEREFNAGEQALMRATVDITEFVEDGDVIDVIIDSDADKDDKVIVTTDDVSGNGDATDDDVSSGEQAHVHTPGKWVTTKAATCTAKGKRVKTCTECGETVESEDIPATGHTKGNFVVVQAGDCGNDEILNEVCPVCGEVIGKKVNAAPGDHSWDGGSVAQPANCGNSGILTYTCTRCGQTTNETIPATGNHEFDLIGEEDVEISPGVMVTRLTYRCLVCGYTYSETY